MSVGPWCEECNDLSKHWNCTVGDAQRFIDHRSDKTVRATAQTARQNMNKEKTSGADQVRGETAETRRVFKNVDLRTEADMRREP